MLRLLIFSRIGNFATSSPHDLFYSCFDGSQFCERGIERKQEAICVLLEAHREEDLEGACSHKELGLNLGIRKSHRAVLHIVRISQDVADEFEQDFTSLLYHMRLVIFQHLNCRCIDCRLHRLSHGLPIGEGRGAS